MVITEWGHEATLYEVKGFTAFNGWIDLQIYEIIVKAATVMGTDASKKFSTDDPQYGISELVFFY